MRATLIADDPELGRYYPVLIHQPREDRRLSWSSRLGAQWYHNGLPTMLMSIEYV